MGNKKLYKDPPRQHKLEPLHPTYPPPNATDDENEQCGGGGTNSSANLFVSGNAPALSAVHNSRAVGGANKAAVQAVKDNGKWMQQYNNPGNEYSDDIEVEDMAGPNPEDLIVDGAAGGIEGRGYNAAPRVSKAKA